MKRKLIWLAVFAVAMAYLEAIVVVYLRELYYPDNILSLFPMRLFRTSDFILELGREAATMLMILSVAMLAERKNFVRIFAAFVYVMGVWDIFYYIWLKVAIGWPVAWGEWDILFLIPTVWLGPWLCPALIALLFAAWGGWILLSGREFRFDALAGVLFVAGSLLALASFLQPGLAVYLRGGLAAVQTWLPHGFWWGLYLPGLALMGAGLWRVTRLPDEETA